MAIIQFEQKSPRGNAEIDTSRLRLGVDGRLWLETVPLSLEQEAAIADRFGPIWRDAVDAVKALGDG